MTQDAPQTPESASASPANANPQPRRGGLWFSVTASSREEQFFLLLAMFIGLFSGLAVMCFRLAIDWTRIGLLGPAPQAHNLRVLFAPALVGLLVVSTVVTLLRSVTVKLVEVGPGAPVTKPWMVYVEGLLPNRQNW